MTNNAKTDNQSGGDLGLQLVAEMERLTSSRHGALAFENACRNVSLLDRGHSLTALREANLGEGDSAIIIAAGPSLRRSDPAAKIKRTGYKGAIIATDSAMSYCLRNGIVPHLTVTLDPHATRIVRWFGDPTLTAEKAKKDDYYRRQDMDQAFMDELRANQEILEALDRHGQDIRIALSTSASATVVDRVLSVGMPIYWWNPMLDDLDLPDSKTRALYRMNRLPCVNAGGNVGTACWMMAHAVLGKRRVALTGIDFSYYDGTPYSSTQYYHEAVALVGSENLDRLFIRIYNPHLKAWFYTDPAYMWYREAFLELAVDADCQTLNCTEGGILFGEHVDFVPLEAFLASVC